MKIVKKIMYECVGSRVFCIAAFHAVFLPSQYFISIVFHWVTLFDAYIQG